MLDHDLVAALERMKLSAGPPPSPPPSVERLTGGVSSDIWRVDLPGGPVCIKRALPKLNVAVEWRAPVERNVYEARWMRIAHQASPGAAPRLLAQDSISGSLAMEYLPADRYPLWKNLLRAGVTDQGFAAQVGSTLAQLHAYSAAHPELANQFPTDGIFYDIRLEPYLIQTGRRHPDLAQRLQALIETTMQHKLALVHGDVSPKNTLCGPDGPVFLDAECAWWGDPAFDVAFCLNHLLLKCIWVPAARDGFLTCFGALAAAYLQNVTWEAPGALEKRAARLLPALLLARVDGKSPVEYITTDAQRAPVRAVGRRLTLDACDHLHQVASIWQQELTR